MIVTLYSFIMAILVSDVLILLHYFLRQRNHFIEKSGINILLLFSLLCILRMVLPVEFPNLQYILEIPLSPQIAEMLRKYFPILRNILLLLWGLGTAYCLFRLTVTQLRFQRLLGSCRLLDKELPKRILASIDTSHKIKVFEMEEIPYPLLIGLRHPTIYLPNLPYTEEQLQHILRHEYNHWKNKDLWMKFLIYIICSVFWWNPLTRLLLKNLDQSLELRCDAVTTERYTNHEKAVYLDTILYSIRDSQPTAFQQHGIQSSGFVSNDKAFLEQRFTLLLKKRSLKKSSLLYQALLLALSAACFLISYTLVIQLKFPLPEITAGNLITDAYLVEQKDGSYLFYTGDFDPIPIPREEVEDGMYSNYEIH